MFYYIEGKVTILEPSLAVLDVGGVGYACNVTMNTVSRLQLNERTRLYTYCNIKEDAFDIYGFWSKEEKRCFELLLSVSGVGPKAAIGILSVVTPEELAVAIAKGDEKRITAAQGVGKRIAQRVILELKDKMALTDEELSAGITSTVSALSPAAAERDQEAMAALGVLGFTSSEASAILRTMDTSQMSVEDIVREALKRSIK